MSKVMLQPSVAAEKTVRAKVIDNYIISREEAKEQYGKVTDYNVLKVVFEAELAEEEGTGTFDFCIEIDPRPEGDFIMFAAAFGMFSGDENNYFNLIENGKLVDVTTFEDGSLLFDVIE